MSVEVKVPTVGESISEVTVANWLKKDGEFVNQDEVICELESDKATFELNAPEAGILKIKAPKDTVLAIGDLLCEIEKTAVKVGEPSASSVPPANVVPLEVGAVKDMKVPTVGESISEVTIANWLKKTGDYVNMDETLCELESDKATFEVTAEASGILEIVAPAGSTLAIGDLICKIKTVSATPENTNKSITEAAPSAIKGAADTKPAATGGATPLAAKILADKGIDPSKVQGSGSSGKITKEDALKAGTSPATPVAKATPASPASTSTSASGRVENRTKLTPLRKTISRRLVAVKNETAMLTTFNEVDMKPIMDLRAKFKDKFKEKHNVGLGFMSFFTKACCTALQEFPSVNAKIDGDEMITHEYVDISIAVSAPKGLVVPVIRNAEQLTFAGVEKAIVELATKARDNKLTIEEMTGGTFTITNGGIFGSMLSTPIINAPQSAILGMHNIVERPVVVNGEIVVRPIMYVALSYDHRIIDGRESVGFLVRVKQLLEDPTRLLLDV